MGALRLILAASVLYGHAGMFLGFPLIPGDTAVQVFYAISGFYMALVLNEKYRPDNSSYLDFMTNRYARLFPAYAIVLLATLALAFLLSRLPAEQIGFVARWRNLPELDWWSALYLVGSQIALFGQDLYHFVRLDGGALAFSANFMKDSPPLYKLLAVPQAWTLGLELWFYLIAPFIVRRRASFILALLLASLALRMTLQFGFGLAGDPWSYRFFPSELALFLAGAFAYRLQAGSAPLDRRKLALLACVALAIGACLLINRWHGLGRIVSVSFLVVSLVAIPFLFAKTKSIAIDRFLGELSYPLYICHFVVIWLFALALGMQNGVVRGIAICATTFLLAAALYWWVDRPVDAWRQRRLRGKRQPAAEVRLAGRAY